MWKFWALGFGAAGAAGAVAVSHKTWTKLQESRDRGDNSPMKMIIKGANSFQEHIGPWSTTDITMGLAAMAKMTEKEPPSPPGQPAEDLSRNAEFLARAQHWRAMAEAVYVCDESSFSLQSQLPESAVVHAEWCPHQDTLRPAYAVCIDSRNGAVVLSIRGTSHILDMVVDAGAAPEPFCGGKAHGGYVHATNALIEEVEPHLKKAFAEVEKKRGADTKLVIVGHSLGGAVGVMCGYKLREKYPGLKCWSFSTPASLTHDLAVECSDFATSIVSAHDMVPRFSMAAVEKVRKRVLDFDWERARQVLKGDPEWDTFQKGMDASKDMHEKWKEGVDGVASQVGMEGNKEQEAAKKAEEEEEAKKMRPPALFPPGRLLVLCAKPPGFGKRPENRSNVPSQRDYGAYASFEESLNTSWELREAKQEEFLELVVSPWSVSDHMLGNLCEGIGFLQSQCSPLSS